MNDWQTCTIKDVVLGLYDGPHATPPTSYEGPIFLGIGNVTEDGHLDLSDIRHIAEADFPRWTKRVTPAQGDIVFTYEATLNRYAIIPEGFRGCLGRRMALLRPDPSKVDTQFLFYSFFSNEWRETIEANRLSGATVDRIPLTRFPDFPIHLPALEIQRRIAGILGAYDDLIEVNRRRIAVLEEMTRGLFTEWFVRLRFPGHEDLVIEDTPDGPLPVGWSWGTLGDFLTLQRGFDLPSTQRVEGAFPIVSASGVTGSHAEGRVSGPGVATGRSGTIGQVHLVMSNFWPLNTTLYVKEFKKAGPAYATLLLRQLDLAKHSTGSAVPTLNRNHVHGVRLAVAPSQLLARFEQIAMTNFKVIDVIRLESERLAAARDLLLPRLISGQLSLTQAEQNLEAA